jgi:hypothetical protein
VSAVADSSKFFESLYPSAYRVFDDFPEIQTTRDKREVDSGNEKEKFSMILWEYENSVVEVIS